MNPPPIQSLQLEALGNCIPVIPEDAVGFYKHNCMVCLHSQGHYSGVALHVKNGNYTTAFTINWNGTVTEELQRAYADMSKATDFAACTLALLLVRELTEYLPVEQSVIGTTIDYWLASKKPEDDLIFNHTARLEVSGILCENEENTIDKRIKQKINRLNPKKGLPALIVVVEFSKPQSKMVNYGPSA